MSVDSSVPQIRFKGFSGEWVENDLGELIDIRSAARVHKEQWTKAGVPFFRTSDVVLIYKGQENAKAFISQEVYQGLSEKIGKLKKDDLLITGGGSIGIPYLVPNDDPLYFKDADLLWLKNDCKFDGYFLYTFFFSSPFKKYLKSISHIGTIAHYTIEQAKSTPINTCDTEEQTAIGSTFQKLDSLINQHQQKHDKLSNIKKAMLEKMFPKQGETIPEIRFKGFRGEWDEISLSDFGIATSGTSIESEFTKDGKYKVISIGSYSENSVYTEQGIRASLSPKTESRVLNKNDLTMILNDKTLAGNIIGRVLLIDEDDSYVYNQRTQRIEPFNEFDPKFLYQFLNAPSIRKKIFKASQGNTQIYVNWSAISKLKYIVPKKDEQTAIGNYFQKLDALINQHQQQITKLNNIKQACLSKMFV